MRRVLRFAYMAPFRRSAGVAFSLSMRCVSRMSAVLALLENTTVNTDQAVALPASLDDVEGVDAASLTKLFLCIPPHSLTSLTFAVDCCKWVTSRASCDLAPLAVAICFTLCDRLFKSAANTSETEGRRAFDELWQFARKYIRAVKPPILCKAFYVLGIASPADEATFTILADRVYHQWRNVSTTEEVYWIVSCLNSVAFTSVRLNAVLADKLPSLLPTSSVEHKAEFLFCSALPRGVQVMTASSLDCGSLPWLTALRVWRWKASRQLPIVAEEVSEKVHSILKDIRVRSQEPGNHAVVEDVKKLISALTDMGSGYHIPPVTLRRLLRCVLGLKQFGPGRDGVASEHLVLEMDDQLCDTLVHFLTHCSHTVRRMHGDSILSQVSLIIEKRFLAAEDKADTISKQILMLGKFLDTGLQPGEQVNFARFLQRAASCIEEFTTSEVTILLSSVRYCKNSCSTTGLLVAFSAALERKIPFLPASELVPILDAWELSGMTSAAFTALLADRAADLAREMSPRQLSRTLCALSALGCTTHTVFTTLTPQLATVCEFLTIKDVAVLIVCYAEYDSNPALLYAQSLMTHVSQKAIHLCERCDPSDAVKIYVAASARPTRYARLLVEYRKRLSACARDLSASETLTLLNTFLKVGHTDASSFVAFLQQVLLNKHLFKDSNVGDIILLCAKVQVKEEDIYHQLALRAIAYGPSLSLETCLRVLHGFALASVRNEELFVVLCNRIIVLRESFNRAQILALFEDFYKLDVDCTAVCLEFIPIVERHVHGVTLPDLVTLFKTL